MHLGACISYLSVAEGEDMYTRMRRLLGILVESQAKLYRSEARFHVIKKCLSRYQLMLPSFCNI